MAAVPTPLDWVAFAGLSPSAAQFQAGVGDVLGFLLSPPLCIVRQTVAQSIGNASFTPLTFTTEDADDLAMHSTVTNTTRVTAVYPGWYQLSGQVGHGVSSTGRRGCLWSRNGTQLNASQALTTASISGGSGTVQVATTTLAYLAVGDYVELQCYQDSGANLTTNVNTTGQSSAAVLWVSR